MHAVVNLKVTIIWLGVCSKYLDKNNTYENFVRKMGIAVVKVGASLGRAMIKIHFFWHKKKIRL